MAAAKNFECYQPYLPFNNQLPRAIRRAALLSRSWSVSCQTHGRQLRGRRPADPTGVGRAATYSATKTAITFAGRVMPTYLFSENESQLCGTFYEWYLDEGNAAVFFS